MPFEGQLGFRSGLQCFFHTAVRRSVERKFEQPSLPAAPHACSFVDSMHAMQMKDACTGQNRVIRVNRFFSLSPFGDSKGVLRFGDLVITHA